MHKNQIQLPLGLVLVFDRNASITTKDTENYTLNKNLENQEHRIKLNLRKRRYTSYPLR